VVPWQQLLAAATILLVYTNAPRVLFDTGVIPLPPVFFVALLAAGALPLLFHYRVAGVALHSPLLIWAMVYAAMVSAGFFVGSQSEVARLSVLTAWGTGLTLGVFLIIFSAEQAAWTARRWMVYATLLAVGINLYEIPHPGTFSHFIGRAAGFYLNPNIAASAILFGMIYGLETVRPSRRPVFVLLAGIGIVATLSRSGILCWGLVGVFQWWTGQIRPRFALIGTVLVAAALVLLALPKGAIGAGIEAVELLSQDQVSRLGVSGSDEVLGSVSVRTRAEVAAKAWRMFEERPLTGYGPGATLEWDIDQSTHNMYLKLLAELGVLGLLLYPGALFAAWWGMPKRHRLTGQTFGIAWLALGMFTHNFFEERHALISLALLAALSASGSVLPSSPLSDEPARPA
jgi:O-antigen ligase